MLSNRSIQQSTVIPVLAYPDVNEAATWLCKAFGFTVRLRVGDSHRVQLNVGAPGDSYGAVTVRELRKGEENAPLGIGHSITIRVENADTHCQQARENGARIIQEPQTFMFGERQYDAEDLAGHQWCFSQSVADIHPDDWGGRAENL